VTLRCKCWHCDLCQPVNAANVVRRAKAGKPTTFITLTANPRRYASPVEPARSMVEAWRTLRRRICARFGCPSLPFFATFEATKRGEPHLHILARAPFIPQRWLSDQMADLTGSPIVDIRHVPDVGRAATYVAKYVGKDPHRFEGCKRFWTSLDWLDDDHREPPAPAVFGDRWVRYDVLLDDIERAMLRLGVPTIRTPRRLSWGERPP
jgi:hypothetical protein